MRGALFWKSMEETRLAAVTAQAEYQLRADSNLLDEIQKRSDLRRREVARGMIGIERIELFRPFGKNLKKLASRKKRPQADREALKNALTGKASGDRD